MTEVVENSLAATAEPVSSGMAGPGALLRRTREERGFGVDDVVQAIKFSHRQIEALEADELATLPGTVFVRGMVRSYARFLKLAPEPLVAMLDNEAPALPPDVRPPDNMGSAMPRTGARQVPLLVALSVLLLVGAGTMAAWHLLAPPVAPIAVPSVAPSVAEPAGMPVAGDGEPAVLAPQPRVEASSATPVAESPAASADSTAGAERSLVFAFRGVSWIEVRDASQQVILTGQFPAGSRQSVVGKPPLHLVIGNAERVDVQYGDQTVDLKPHTRAEVARLALE